MIIALRGPWLEGSTSSAAPLSGAPASGKQRLRSVRLRSGSSHRSTQTAAAGRSPERRPANRVRTLAGRRIKQSGALLWIVAGLLVPVLAHADLLTVSVTSQQQTVIEGGEATFEVRLTGGTGSEEVVVTYELGGTAKGGPVAEGGDYTVPSPKTVMIDAESDSKTFPITTLPDEVLEGAETLTVTLLHVTTMAGTVRLGTPKAATTTIVDGGTVTVSVTEVDALAADAEETVEEGNPQTFSVNLTGAVSEDVTIGYSTASGTAVTGADYTAPSAAATLVIPAGTTMATITVATLEDSREEDSETFTVTLALSDPPARVTLGKATAKATIKDDDPLTASVSGPDNVAEGTAATFTVTLTGGISTEDVIVDYSVSGADVDVDYKEPPGKLTIPAGMTKGTVVIQTISDSSVDDETLTLTLTGAVTSGRAVAWETDLSFKSTMIKSTATVTVSVSAVTSTVNEGSPAKFVVTLSKPVPSVVPVVYSTSDGTAVDGTSDTEKADYTPAESDAKIEISAGATTGTIMVETVEDELAEADETFTLSLANETGAELGIKTATATIRDDDTPTVSVTPLKGTVTEGNAATFEVRLTGGTGSEEVVVTYELGGTAKGGPVAEGGDYTVPSPKTVTIAAKSDSGTFPITTVMDEVLEGAETLTVTLLHVTTTAGTVRLGTPKAATTNIGDGDGQVTVSVMAVDDQGLEDPTVNEGDAKTFTVSLTGGTVSEDVTVRYTTASGTATTADYSSARGTLTIPAGSTTATITVPTLQDEQTEAPETFTVRLTSPTGGVAIETGIAPASIKDDEVVTASVSGPENVAAGEGAEYTVSLEVVVPYDLTGAKTGSSSVKIPKGKTKGTFRVPTDGLSGTLTVTLGDPTTVAGSVDRGTPGTKDTVIGAAGTVTVSVSPTSVTVSEGDAARFTVRLSKGAASKVTVTYSTDLIPPASGEVTIPTGSRSAPITVETMEDELAEADETFTLSLDSAMGAELGIKTATATIRDDDTPTVSVTPLKGTVTEGNAATFEVRLTGGTGSEEVVVTYELGGTAKGGPVAEGGDYTVPSPKTVTIAAKSDSQTFPITTLPDEVLEGAETLTVTLLHVMTTAGTVRLGTPKAATTNIGDGAGQVTVSVMADDHLGSEDPTVDEGDAQTFTVSLTGTVSEDVTVRYTTASGTATTADYSSARGTLTIPAGSTTATITVPTLQDEQTEAPETFTVRLTSPTGGVAIETGIAPASIKDDEVVTASVSGPENVAAGEGAEYTVSLTGGTGSAEVVVPYDLTGAKTGSSSVKIPKGKTKGTFRVPTDGLSGTTLTVTLGDPTTVAGSVDRGTPGTKDTVIGAAGTVTVSVSPTSVTVSEGDAARFTVRLSKGAASKVTVTYSTDLIPPASGEVTIPTGSRSAPITVETMEDELAEADETFTLSLDSAMGAELGIKTATATIRDDDTPTVSVTSQQQTVIEGGEATFEVRLTGGTGSEEVVVTYELGGTAKGGPVAEGGDYTVPSPKTVTIAAKSDSQTFPITTLPDKVLEGAETLTVTLLHVTTTAGTVRLGTPKAATTNIGDDAGQVTVSVMAVDHLGVEDPTVNEGYAKTFTVSLTGGPVSEDVTVRYTTVPGTATPGADYTAAESAASVVIGAGQTTVTIMVETLEDRQAENTETFTVTLSLSSPPAKVAIETGTAIASIIDNEEVTASVSGPENVAEGMSAKFTVKLSGGSGSEAVVVDYKVLAEGDTAMKEDYEAPSGGLTIPKQATVGSFVIRIKSDGVPEGDENLTVTLADNVMSAGDVQVDATAKMHSTTIKPAGTVTVSVSDVTVVEGDPAKFTVSMSGKVPEAVTVQYSTPGDSTDYRPVTGAKVVIPAGATTATVTVETVPDTIAEDEETFTLSLDSASGDVEIGMKTATATIKDDTLSVSVVGPERDVPEGENAIFTVTLTRAHSEAVDVTYTVTGTVTTEDYTSSGGTLRLSAGTTTATIVIATAADGVQEADETLIVTLTGATTVSSSATVGSPARAVATIEDRDEAVTVSVENPATVVEGDPVTFTVTLSGKVSTDVTVGYSTVNGTATAGEDYTAVASGTVVVAAGQTTATFTVATLEDSPAPVAEENETFTVTLTELTEVDLPARVTLSTATATATITDYALLATVRVPSTVAEGSAATFTVTLVGGANRSNVAVPYSVGGTAREATDYTAPSGRLTIPANAQSGTITIQTRSDDVLDHGETLVVTLEAPTTQVGVVRLGTPSVATATIADSGTVTVSVDGATSEEGDPVVFMVTLSGLVAEPVMVGYRTADGSARAGNDYTSVSGMLTIVAPSTSATFTVATIEDSDGEGAETFTVRLSLPADATSGVKLRTETATATITDDDIALQPIPDVTVTEGEVAPITLMLERALPEAVTLRYSTVAGTATAADYSMALPDGTPISAQGEFTLPAGTQERMVAVLAVDDSLAEADETFTVEVWTVPTAGQPTRFGTATVTIEDNDELSASVTAPKTVVEGKVAQFTVKVGGGTSTADVRVSYSLGGTAKAPADYTAPSPTMVVPAGQKTATIAIQTKADKVLEPDETLVVTLTEVTTTAGAATVGSPKSATTRIQDPVTLSINRVNEALLPGVTRASASGVLEAVSARMTQAAQGDPPAATAGLAGLTGLYRALQANERALQDGSYDLAQVLGGSSFLVPLSSHDGDSGGGVRAAFWGGGDFRGISGGDTDAADVDWDGSVWSARLGADMRFVDSLLTGLAVSWTSGGLDYIDQLAPTDREGTYATWLISAHPYVGWTTTDFGLWATGGFGFGGVSIDDADEDYGAQEADLTQWSLGTGASVTLLSTDWFIAGGTTSLKLKAEGFLAGASVAENEAKTIQALDVGVNQARAAIEASHAQHFADGGTLKPSLEIGGRLDGGHGETGAGLEVGGGVTYADSASGLTVAGGGRALVIHGGNYGEWRLSGLIQLDPNSAGHGLSMSVRPTLGVAASGVNGLWEHGTIDLLAGSQPGGRVEAEIGYGLPAFGTAGVLTPYAGVSLTDAGDHSLSLGGRIELRPAFDLSLEAERRESSDGDTAEHDLTLEGSIRW